MQSTDWVMVFAVLLSPLIAVQVDKFLERDRRHKERQIEVFRILMATRAAGLSGEHVGALNTIDIEFHSQKKITSAWKAYLDHLTDRSLEPGVWSDKRGDLLVELLYVMADFLRFKFDKVHIKRVVYSPQAFGDIEEDYSTIRRGIAAVLKGEKPFLTASMPEPGSEEETNEQAELRKLMIAYYRDPPAIAVKLVEK